MTGMDIFEDAFNFFLKTGRFELFHFYPFIESDIQILRGIRSRLMFSILPIFYKLLCKFSV